jgi:CheY-like chemotaxis protein
MRILPIIADGVAPTGIRILVAEDGLVHQRLIRGLLRRCNCCVTIVGNGQEVLSVIQNHTYDVVLMDVEMPTLDGLASTRRIRELEKDTGTHIPIIAVTDRDNADECLEAGMDAHLKKPVSTTALCGLLENLLGRPCWEQAVAAPVSCDVQTT